MGGSNRIQTIWIVSRKIGKRVEKWVEIEVNQGFLERIVANFKKFRKLFRNIVQEKCHLEDAFHDGGYDGSVYRSWHCNGSCWCSCNRHDYYQYIICFAIRLGP